MSKLSELYEAMKEAEDGGEFFAILPTPSERIKRYDVFVANGDIFKEFWKWWGTYSRPDDEPVSRLVTSFKNVEDLWGKKDSGGEKK